VPAGLSDGLVSAAELGQVKAGIGPGAARRARRNGGVAAVPGILVRRCRHAVRASNGVCLEKMASTHGILQARGTSLCDAVPSATDGKGVTSSSCADGGVHRRLAPASSAGRPLLEIGARRVREAEAIARGIRAWLSAFVLHELDRRKRRAGAGAAEQLMNCSKRACWRALPTLLRFAADAGGAAAHGAGRHVGKSGAVARRLREWDGADHGWPLARWAGGPPGTCDGPRGGAIWC